MTSCSKNFYPTDLNKHSKFTVKKIPNELYYLNDNAIYDNDRCCIIKKILENDDSYNMKYKDLIYSHVFKFNKNIYIIGTKKIMVYEPEKIKCC